MYAPGEKIWFKIYVVDAFTHQSPTDSRYAYVELINSSDSLIQRVMVELDDNGLFHGNVFISRFLPEGDYTLRAYTRYMENQGEDYFFKKNIRIYNLTETKKQITKQSNVTYDVSFYPEGGYMTDGISCRVAFKAMDNYGASENITGKIVDNAGNSIVKVTTFHAGMGSFYLFPEATKAYYLRCKNSAGQEKRFMLPKAQKTYSLAVGNQNNRYLVEVRKSPDIREQPLYLLVHCRGRVLYFAPWNDSNKFITFPNDGFPSGVIQLTLFNGQMNPISERLVFNKNDDQARLAFSLNKQTYEKRDSVHAEIQVTDPQGNPLAGNISVAVTDDKDIVADTNYTILSSLLLSSELKGYIESPGYYLQDNENAKSALDLLMMTNGWRRYDISEAIKGNYMFPEVQFEKTKEITGSVKSLLLGKPVRNGEVTLVSNDGSYGQTVTDSTGSFCFNVHYPDSVIFFVQAKNPRGGTRVELFLNQEKFPLLKHAPKSMPVSSGAGMSIQAADDTIDFIKKASQRAQYDENMRLIQLPEVVITANRIEKRDEVRLATWPFNRGSDKTIYREEIEERHVHRITDLFYDVAGVQINEILGLAYIRGYNRPAALVIDGIIRDGYTLNDIPIEAVESIDIFKSSSSAIFGMRGAGGAISITTRRGENHEFIDNNFNTATFSSAGYQKPVEFYSPKYDTPESKRLGVPDFRSTIFWKPDLLVPADGKTSFEFYTADSPTTYSVVIEGLSDDGRIIRQVETIEVR